MERPLAVENLSALLTQGMAVEPHRPWPRRRVSREGWGCAVELLARGACTLVSLWGDRAEVHLALLDERAGSLAVVSIDAAEGRFPSVARTFPPAARLERAIHDLFGLVPEGATDMRPWLDHGRWGLRAPMGARSPAPQSAAADYPFLPTEGESLHQIPVGPVHAGTIEP